MSQKHSKQKIIAAMALIDAVSVHLVEAIDKINLALKVAHHPSVHAFENEVGNALVELQKKRAVFNTALLIYDSVTFDDEYTKDTSEPLPGGCDGDLAPSNDGVVYPGKRIKGDEPYLGAPIIRD